MIKYRKTKNTSLLPVVYSYKVAAIDQNQEQKSTYRQFFSCTVGNFSKIEPSTNSTKCKIFFEVFLKNSEVQLFSVIIPIFFSTKIEKNFFYIFEMSVLWKYVCGKFLAFFFIDSESRSTKLFNWIQSEWVKVKSGVLLYFQQNSIKNFFVGGEEFFSFVWLDNKNIWRVSWNFV